MRIDVLTLFPEMFGGVFSESIIKRGQEKGLLALGVTNIRDYALDAHRSVDDKPFGGGAGMVMMCQPIFDAAADVQSCYGPADEIVLLSPQGERFSQAMAREFGGMEHLLIIAGHYEGYDERIRQHLATKEVSIGDYVLSGGEIPAMVVADAVVRLLPGVLGNAESSVEESFSEELLEYPQYTRPADFRGMKAPEVLLSGHHEKVRQWRQEQRRKRTQDRRPDLLGDRR